MTASGYTLFETAIGHCGVAWGEHGLVHVQLPEGSPQRTRARLLRYFRGTPEAAPTPEVRRAIDDMVRLLAGDRTDLSGIEVDLREVPEFHRRVYEVARTIPPGATLTYGDIAARLGAPGSARAVGQALGRNPVPIVVPCHRVLAAGGKMGGFSANGGTDTKHRMLVIEGAQDDAPTLF
ncbi:methylated-DNA--[protein]-cysteine S-methyltransferase [Amycolatopsis nigrescens]|uniref:methylated-DNA--[protein]-cysteine S-methyltransferase n=1 Tax=Amycolatopsis nigrescens TaxID=381445 RepID=UPI00037D476C|nr:methylated-DNA--[protein]-cysteine S-methyltransferase [Amycolatopsis nigrescens]